MDCQVGGVIVKISGIILRIVCKIGISNRHNIWEMLSVISQ